MDSLTDIELKLIGIQQDIVVGFFVIFIIAIIYGICLRKKKKNE